VVHFELESAIDKKMELLDLLVWASGILFMATAVAWISFARITMARIEREIMRDGFPRPCPWDGPGARVVWYAHAIAVPIGRFNRFDDPLIDVPLVRKYATRADIIRGRVFLAIGYLGTIVTVVGGIMLDT
jgi:hypothetical protein